MSDRIIHVTVYPLAEQISLIHGNTVTCLSLDDSKQLYSDLADAIGKLIDGGKPMCEAP